MDLFNQEEVVVAPKKSVTITLRPNQVEPVEVGIKYFQEKNPKPAIIVAPTAFGKSIVVGKIAYSVQDKLLVLQPSKELLEQNISKYRLLGGTADIYSASLNRKVIADTTYATIGSIKNIGAKFKDLGFTKMIIDECHLYPRNIDSMIGKFMEESGITHVLGLTATPLKLQKNYAMDGTPFSKLSMLTSRSKVGQFYKSIIHVAQISDMVKMGYWAKLKYELFEVDDRGLVYNSAKSDYTDESLMKMYEKNDVMSKVVRDVNELQHRRGIIVFVPTVPEAQNLAEKTPKSAAVYSGMNPKERQRIIIGFKSGEIKTIYNVNILSVGFDYPELDTIILARPTASLAWYYQALGRGTRIHPNKDHCLIRDYSGNVERFGKLESLYFEKGYTWEMYGEDGNKLTGIPLHEIGSEKHKKVKKVVKEGQVRMTHGKHKGEFIQDIPSSYRKWMYENFKWNSTNKHIKAEIKRIDRL